MSAKSAPVTIRVNDATRQHLKRRAYSRIRLRLSECWSSFSLDDWWTWELLAALLSITAFAGIVITLLLYTGRQAPELPVGFTVG